MLFQYGKLMRYWKTIVPHYKYLIDQPLYDRRCLKRNDPVFYQPHLLCIQIFWIE